MNILFIGDIVGKVGRKTLTKLLPKLKKEYKIDLVIANGENAAHGSGVTEETLKEMQKAGVDYFTNGDHAFRRTSQIETIHKKYPILRPANWSDDILGKGYSIIDVKGKNVLIINLIGRVFMKSDYNCPFKELDKILANLANQNLSAIIIDIHAEATSEKVCMGHYADGRVSAILGTHTHVMTADQKITKKGTAYITDVGMTGAANQAIGIDKEKIIEEFLTQIKYPHKIPESGEAQLNAVVLKIDSKNKKAKSIKPVLKYTNIK